MTNVLRIKKAVLAALLLTGFGATAAMADPLPGEVLKFQQLPLDNLAPIPGTLPYWGHDELSTAYGQQGAAPAPVYVGRFMADDFADKFTTPVVHISWWGSYLFNNHDMPVNKFLISFEKDVPADAAGLFSHPGDPLLTQVVTRGALAPGSGTFTEQPVSAGGPPLNEGLFKYNAELNLGAEFFEHPDTVYWLKIVALVDVPALTAFDPLNPPQGVTQWGWHDRDYTQMDPFASTPPGVAPGEHIVGFVPGTTIPIWHFQDDAVSGSMQALLIGDNRAQVSETGFAPMNYLDNIDGPTGIGQFSKDLAFSLYTRDVPEPATLTLLGLGGVAILRRRKK